MKLWSHGLGKRELKMDFRRCAIRKGSDGEIEVLGLITEPITWEFRITLGPEDVAGMIRLGLHPSILAMILANSPKYLDFLRKRGEFKPSDDMVERVQGAFEKMMKRGGRVDAWKQSRAARAAEGGETPEPAS